MSARCAAAASDGRSDSAFAWKDAIFFNSSPNTSVNNDAVSSVGESDGMGELREEEIVWGIDDDVTSAAGCGNNCRPLHNDGRRLYRSMLSLQLESQEFHAVGLYRSNIKTGSHGSHNEFLYHGMRSMSIDDDGDDGAPIHGSNVELGMDHTHLHIIPPHELTARQYSSTPTSSVLHGAGRTLKGMDLRRLRNEVWRQTGFMD